MRYIPSTSQQQDEMLKEIGVSSFDKLIESIPEKIRLNRKLNIPAAYSDNEIEDLFFHISQKKADFYKMKPLIGAGSYRHFIPEAEKALLQREEFWTCYTPYQPELSQGTLQAMFEYQTYISRLTKMEVVVPSIFDGASAAAEAALMSLRITHKNKIIVSSLIHPHYLETIKTYLSPHNVEIIKLPYQNGLSSINKIENLLDDETAAVLIQSPNFFGGIENIENIANKVHQKNSILIHIITESLSLGILKSPGSMDVDIVAANSQSFGIDLNFGGPHNAFLATKKKYIRQLPGRIAGETTDKNGKRSFVMTFRAREQDIRREKATSNICTNHNLNVIASNIYLALMGTDGIYQYARLNAKKAHYLENQLLQTGKFKKLFDYPFFNEFLLKYNGDRENLDQVLLENNFIPPLFLRTFYPGEVFSKTWLFAVTEIFTRKELDKITNLLSN